jgi:hypothetical protein
VEVGCPAPTGAARIGTVVQEGLDAVDDERLAGGAPDAIPTDFAATGAAADPNRAPPACDASGADRRAVPRHASGYSVVVRHIRAGNGRSAVEEAWAWHGAPARGELLDVSLTGLACLVLQPLERGQRIDIQLWNLRRDVRLERAATVLRCLPAGPNRWKVVCRLATPLGVDDLQWVAQHLLPHPIV